MFMANWDNLDAKGDVEDRRGSTAVATGALGTIGTILFIAISLFGGDNAPQLQEILSQVNSSIISANSTKAIDANDSYVEFSSKVIGSGNLLWKPIVEGQGRQYVDPKLVLFRNLTSSQCSVATSAIGPHYCPGDNTIYLDETFFEELKSELGAKGGDVAEAYVIAHELGHHVQNAFGLFEQSEADSHETKSSNEQSIAMELQADCYAGVWAYTVANQQKVVFEPGEIEEAIDAAGAVGDDRLQKNAGQEVNEESWTHGSAADRIKWFKQGYTSGDYLTCNTF